MLSDNSDGSFVVGHGWDVLLIDLDDGVNVKRKLQTMAAKHGEILCFNLYHLLKMFIGSRLCTKPLRLLLELSSNFWLTTRCY